MGLVRESIELGRSAFLGKPGVKLWNPSRFHFRHLKQHRDPDLIGIERRRGEAPALWSLVGSTIAPNPTDCCGYVAAGHGAEPLVGRF
jgi:hypothetical protein